MNKRKKVVAIIEASKTGFGVYSESLIGITGYGKTVEEAKKDLKVAITEVLEAHKADGTLPPKELNGGKLDFEYKYDFASLFENFRMLDVSNFAKKIGMNPSLLRQYKTGAALASSKQKQKIESGLHELGRELMSVRL